MPCGNATCAPGRACDAVHVQCVAPEQLSSCEGQEPFATCQFPGQNNGRCFDGTCFARGCGNGFVEPEEVCDDGNNESADGCSADCRSDETCGNRVVDNARGEGCDDGNTIDGDGCQSNCIVPTCGDGVVDTEFNEVCDCGQDPASLPTGCTATNGSTPDAPCRNNCQPRACGDGIIDPGAGETCDDGNTLPGDGCAGTCQAEVCGNGRIDVQQVEGGFVPAEDCDDANTIELDGCDSRCRQAPRTWARVTQPDSRGAPRLVYDASRAVTVLFGATDAVWEWDGYAWRRIETRVGPSANPLPAAYDHARRTTVAIDNGVTWGWNGRMWQRLDVGDGPPLEARLVYDPVRQQVVSIGGFRVFGDAVAITGEIWTWDGVMWTEVDRIGEQPDPFDIGVIAYDIARQKIVMAGFDDKVWEWNGEGWASVTPDGERPSGAESSFAMLYDPVREHVTLHVGGSNMSPSTVWDWLGTRWAQRSTAGGPPPARLRPAVAYDTARNSTVMFGGEQPDGRVRTDTWLLRGDRWRIRVQRATPAPSLGPAMAYDARRGRAVIFSEPSRTLWEWDGSTWKNFTPTENLLTGNNYRVAYHETRERIVLVGTVNGTLDHWEWDGATMRAVPTSAQPQAADCLSLGYDRARDTLVLLTGGPVEDCFGDAATWLWDGTDWRDSGESGVSPGAPVAYDPNAEHLILFGGPGNSMGGNVPRQTWRWDGTTWADISPEGLTPPAGSHALAFDGARGRITLLADNFGGTWEWLGDAWRQVTVADDDGLSAVEGARSMTYDALRGRMIFVDTGATRTWLSAHYTVGAAACQGGFDPDGDGLTGCDDPDCWGFCTPNCPPGTPCDESNARCGDAMCDQTLENCRLCPTDCGACTPVCGDFLCDADETSESCPADCR